MTDKIIVKVKPTIEDYIQFNKAINQKFLKRSWGICIIFILILIVAIMLNEDKSFEMILENFIQPVFIVILALGLLNYSIIFKSKKAYGNNQYLSEEKTYEFDDEYINTLSKSDDSKFGWNKVTKVVENKDVFIIFISNVQGMFIPKNSFGKGEDIDIFRELLKGKIDNKKISRV